MPHVGDHARLNLHALDALRGFLAVYVLLGHARWLLWQGHAAWLASAPEWWEYPLAYASAALRYGHEMVMVFFALSGFFIHMPVARDLAANRAIRFSASEFAQRRFFRLVPTYLFVLAITFLLDAVGRELYPILYQARTGDVMLDTTFSRADYSLQSVIPALLLLPSSLGHSFGSNGPLWSLAYEAVYYAAYPLWLFVRNRSAFAAYAVVPVAAFSIAAVMPGDFPASVLRLWPVWIAGAGLCEYACRGYEVRRPIVSGLGMAAIGFALLHVSTLRTFTPLFYILFGAGLIVAANGIPKSAVQNMLLRTAESLGVRSYTIYILHFPILSLVSAYLISENGARPLHGWMALTGGLLAVLVCWAAFQLCEKRFLRRRYEAARAPASATAIRTANLTGS